MNPLNRLSKHIVAPPFDNSRPEFSFRTRNNHWSFLKSLGDQPLNVLIVGGGIVGAGLLRELALRDVGMCCLVEKHDFASGTSSASSKLIHAGIRYLEQSWESLKKRDLAQAWRNFIYVFQASNERRLLGEIAPHLVKPKPIYFVISESDRRPLFGVFLGVWLYYLIQLFQGQFFRLPKTIYRKDAIRWMAPELDAKQVRAIFSFWDSETDDARLVIENLQSANAAGALALNYVEFLSYQKKGATIQAILKNNQNGEQIRINTKVLINASGAFVDDVRKKEVGSSIPASNSWVDRVAGAHINVFPAVSKESYYVTAGDGRLVFVLRREEDGLVYSRIGTTERPMEDTEPSDSPKPTEWEIQYLRDLVENYFPNAHITDDNLINADAGIRPLMSQINISSFQKSREHRIIYEGNAVHVVGVKLTDYRKVARELVNEMDWEEFGINVSGNTHHIDVRTLREFNSRCLYDENSLEEIVSSSMVIRPEDYVYRRRGFRGVLLQRKDPDKLRGELKKLEELLR